MSAMDVKTVSTETLAGRDFYLCLGDFLDEFYRAGNGSREEMIENPPEFSMPRKQLAYLAAGVNNNSGC